MQLAKTVALATCAFESYTQPENVVGNSWYNSQTGDPRDANVRYLSRDYLRETFAGVLYIRNNDAEKNCVFPRVIAPFPSSWKRSIKRRNILYGQEFLVDEKTFRLREGKIEINVRLTRHRDESHTSSSVLAETALMMTLPIGSTKIETIQYTNTENGEQEAIDLEIGLREITDDDPGQEEERVRKPSVLSRCINGTRWLGSCAWESIFLLPYWRSLVLSAGRYKFWEPVAFLSSSSSDTQAWIFRDAQEKEIVISFRGTEGVKLLDVLTDLDLLQAPLDFLEDERSEGKRNKKQTIINSHLVEARAHRGFINAYETVRSEVLHLVHDILESWEDDNDDKNIYVTGHSLGGGLATLCTCDLALRNQNRKTGTRVNMVAFGCPRVGNMEFAAIYNATVAYSAMWNTEDDLVATLPAERIFAQHFTHVRNDIAITDGGSSTTTASCNVTSDRDDVDNDIWETWKSAAHELDTAQHCKYGALDMACKICIQSLRGKLLTHLPIGYYIFFRNLLRKNQNKHLYVV